MIDHSLRVALCRSITARALLYGAESAELEAQAESIFDATEAAESECDNPWTNQVYISMGGLLLQAEAARRRYWREVSAAARLSGMPWPEAEALGVEPTAPVSTSQQG
jgi:hypothetical protein